MDDMSQSFSDVDRPALDYEGLTDALCAPLGPYRRLELVESTGSTNSDLGQKAAADKVGWSDLSVLAAEEQTAGKGRLDREWTAPPRSSVIVSVLLRPFNHAGNPVPTQSYAWFSLLAAVSLAEALGEYAKLDAAVKWPNDVMVGGKKISGILAQIVSYGDASPPAVVIGTGLNVTMGAEDLPVPTATSVALEKGATTDRNILLMSYLRIFAQRYRQFCDVNGDPKAQWSDGTSLLSRLQRVMSTLGQQVRAQLPQGREIVGEAFGLDSFGALKVREADGTEHVVAAGDVVHLRPLEGS
jgi:BirA family transcriptional regulator, biotin operon repressor / biotin---[acetyl-CoA-carboxylase] ligase